MQTAAFRRPDTPAGELPIEAPLVDALRADPDAWIPELSLVAVDDDDRVLAHVVCSRAWVGEGRRPMLGLGNFQVCALADHDPMITRTFRYAPAFD